ncbi:hypothetical protein [Thermomonospora catenispora]|uniref:hypothetical protein n=1 Tax=Thermomonospora catenispora TaxID=2493090 RepID=UPI001120073B|nr:hypothetical protein [Thermomonospora catenispora]TNY37820.1 hypothetical protein EIO00_06610 [Thermomonospora catenispora]
MTRASIALPVAVALLALTGCGEVGQAAKEGFEIGKRQGMLQVAGAEAIEQRTGIPLKGDLSCDVENEDPSATAFTCRGAAEDGREITLIAIVTSTAPLSRSDWVRGEFVVRSGEEELFRADCLGNC